MLEVEVGEIELTSCEIVADPPGDNARSIGSEPRIRYGIGPEAARVDKLGNELVLMWLANRRGRRSSMWPRRN